MGQRTQRDGVIERTRCAVYLVTKATDDVSQEIMKMPKAKRRTIKYNGV